MQLRLLLPLVVAVAEVVHGESRRVVGREADDGGVRSEDERGVGRSDGVPAGHQRLLMLMLLRGRGQWQAAGVKSRDGLRLLLLLLLLLLRRWRRRQAEGAADGGQLRVELEQASLPAAQVLADARQDAGRLTYGSRQRCLCLRMHEHGRQARKGD